MFGALLHKPQLSVTLDDNNVFIYPSSYEDNFTLPATSREPLLHGTVVLSLPSARAIAGITLTLRSATNASAGTGHPYEARSATHHILRLPLAGEVLPAGKHFFSFSLIVPSILAPTQRCTFGRTRYYVEAKAVLKSTLGTSSCSSTAPVSIVALPPPAEPSRPDQFHLQHFNEDLGPIKISFTSPFLTVGGLLDVELSLSQLTKAIKITSINVSIVQQCRVKYGSNRIVLPTPQLFLLQKVVVGPSTSSSTCDHISLSHSQSHPFSPRASNYVSATSYPSTIMPDEPFVESSTIAELAPDQAYSYSRTLRMPSDNHIIPTTLPGTEALISASHAGQLEIRYFTADADEEKILILGRDINIASCCTFDESLPPYSASAPTFEKARKKCSCHFSVREMIQEYYGGRTAVGVRRISLGEANRASKSPTYSA